MNPLKSCLLLLIALSTLGSNNLSAATTLSAAMTVDNQFTAYISTNDSVQGTQIGTGNNWPTTYNFNTALTPGVTNYLHIVATDLGAPAMFIGSFTLNNGDFEFHNGTQSLVSNTTNWSVSTTGFGSNYSAPQNLGAQGTGPWGNYGGINAAARFIWHSGGPGNTVYFSTPISPVEAGGTTRATFTVQKYFHDHNDETDVTLNIQCFTGVPLNQSQTVNPNPDGEVEVEFVVESFNDGELDCDVWEDPVSGYSATYEAYSSYADSYGDDDEGCHYEDVDTGGRDEYQNVCVIANFPHYQTVTINKDWVIEGSGGDELDSRYKLELVCQGPDFPEDHPGVISGGKYYKGNWHKWFKDLSGASGEEYSAEVLPDWKNGTECWVNEKVYDSSIEVNNACGDKDDPVLKVSIGAGAECTITNTVFYEGIPTLSQYGMAILALLMLGVGFVGFRRFV